MQTFLPWPDFEASARVLDNSRLGKQRVETLGILRVLAGDRTGYSHHPAVLQWRGHERLLIVYGQQVCLEWRRRGQEDTTLWKILAMWDRFPEWTQASPWWLGYGPYHASHRSNLRRKDHAYGAFWDEPADLPYLWPSKLNPARLSSGIM